MIFLNGSKNVFQDWNIKKNVIDTSSNPKNVKVNIFDWNNNNIQITQTFESISLTVGIHDPSDSYPRNTKSISNENAYPFTETGFIDSTISANIVWRHVKTSDDRRLDEGPKYRWIKCMGGYWWLYCGSHVRCREVLWCELICWSSCVDLSQ